MTPAHPVVRIGISARNMGSTNRTDVSAAMKAWMQSVTRERNLGVDPAPIILDSVADMITILRLKQIDVLAAPSDEFLLVDKAVPLSAPFASKVGGSMGEQYVLLVRGDRNSRNLKDLVGETLIVLDHPRNALALPWLETELARNRLPASARFFGRVAHVGKLNLAILPVFFKQAGVALVSRRNFETSGELNPQLAKEVQVLASSPELVPSLTAFRLDAAPVVVENYLKEAGKLGESPAGRLILNLFQIEGVVELRESDLVGTRALLAEYARLKLPAEQKGAAP